MRRMLLTTAAVAALTIALPAAHAQMQDSGRDRTPAASAAPQSGNQGGGERAAPQQGRSSGQATPDESSRGNQMRAGDSNQRGTAGGQAQDSNRAEQTEQGRSSDQAGQRSNEQRRDARDRNEARDQGQDRTDQERSTSRERGDGDRQRDRADRDRNRDQADRERDRNRADRNRDRDQAGDRNRDRDRDRADRNRDRDRDRADRRDSRRDISLSQEQRTRISARFSDRIDRLNVRVLPRSRLSVSVGVVVPSVITLYDVPTEIVEIYPAFRRHKFVVVEDEIVIIEPRTRKVVTTISREGGRTASRSSTTTGTASTGARVQFRPEQRETIRTIVMREAECRHELRLDFSIGLPLPRTVEICEFPDAVLTAIPEIREYRYIVRGDDIVIVDPDGYRIVEVID